MSDLGAKVEESLHLCLPVAIGFTRGVPVGGAKILGHWLSGEVSAYDFCLTRMKS